MDFKSGHFENDFKNEKFIFWHFDCSFYIKTYYGKILYTWFGCPHNSLTVLDQALSLLQRQRSLESLLQATIIDSSDDTLSPSRLEKCLLKHWSTKRLFWLRLTSIIFPQLLEAIRILFEDSNGIMYEISSCKTWTGVISVEGVNALPFDVPITKRPASENWNKNLDFIEVNSKISHLF